MRQDCLASKARLKSSKSLNPKLPITFGCVIASYETQLGFLWPSLPPHQNFLINIFRCSQRSLGNLKQDIEKTRTACATDFTNTSFPAVDMVISIQPHTFLQSLSLRYLKAPFFKEPISDGMPKYFSLRVSLGIFIIPFISCLTFSGQLLLK